MRGSTRTAQRAMALLAGVGALALGGRAGADGRTEFLTRMLRESEEYRVRVTAANTLGQIGDPAAVPGLLAALGDDNGAVRAAAASALGRIGEPSALPALAALRRDPQAPVRREAERSIRRLEQVARHRPPPPPPPVPPPAPTGSFQLGVGGVSNPSGVRGAEMTRLLREYLEQGLSQQPGVVVVGPNGRPPFVVDAAITKVLRTGGDVRAEVNVFLLTNPGRDLRSILRGAATVSGGSMASPEAEADMQNQALQGAVTGALRRLGQAMEAAGPGP